jgi:hypothetical protein
MTCLAIVVVLLQMLKASQINRLRNKTNYFRFVNSRQLFLRLHFQEARLIAKVTLVSIAINRLIQ